jgi:hypothetical protein
LNAIPAIVRILLIYCRFTVLCASPVALITASVAYFSMLRYWIG